LPTTIEEAVVLAQLYVTAAASVARTSGSSHAIAYAAATDQDWVKTARYHHCGKIGHLKRDSIN
jgi:hypothetical protein